MKLYELISIINPLSTIFLKDENNNICRVLARNDYGELRSIRHIHNYEWQGYNLREISDAYVVMITPGSGAVTIEVAYDLSPEEVE